MSHKTTIAVLIALVVIIVVICCGIGIQNKRMKEANAILYYIKSHPKSDPNVQNMIDEYSH